MRARRAIGEALARAALVATVVLAAPSPTRAHLGHQITQAERYLKLDVAGGTARVIVSLTLGAREGARVLEAADTNADGEVVEAERDAYLAQWAEGLRTELPVSVDGEPVELAWGEPYMDPIGPVHAVPVTVELVAHVALAGRQTLRIADRMVRREVYERTDVAFRVRDGATLVASGMGEDVTEPIADLAYPPSAEPVVLTAIVTAPERPTECLPWIALAVVGALALATAATLLVRRRARASKR